ncbi:MAG: hypothetical protein WBY53_03180 [Acidobacteriaceae bacterium]
MQPAAPPPTILLIAPESISPPIADALRADLRAEVEATPSRQAALTLLRRNDFVLLLIEESLTADSSAADHLYQNAGTALILELNLALSSASRVVRQARSALARRAHDLAQAQVLAASNLNSELNASLAGILLETQLALRDALPAQAPRLRRLVDLATDLRERLRP